jgi:PAS domain-containing protein
MEHEVCLLADLNEIAPNYIDMVGSIILALDTEGYVVFANKRCLDVVCAKDKGDILCSNWIEKFLPKEVRGSVSATFKKIVAGKLKGDIDYENEIVDLNGNRHLIKWHNSFAIKNKKITTVLATGDDITDLREHEKKLGESLEELKAINKLMVGRELKMIELKREIEELKQKLGKYEAKEKI